MAGSGGRGMKSQTVGELIEMLSKFPFGTVVLNNCGSCHKGEVGGHMTISDQTDQTFGYIELNFNQSWKSIQGGNTHESH
jgi:hypothetical protein